MNRLFASQAARLVRSNEASVCKESHRRTPLCSSLPRSTFISSDTKEESRENHGEQKHGTSREHFNVDVTVEYRAEVGLSQSSSALAGVEVG